MLTCKLWGRGTSTSVSCVSFIRTQAIMQNGGKTENKARTKFNIFHAKLRITETKYPWLHLALSADLFISGVNRDDAYLCIPSYDPNLTVSCPSQVRPLGRTGILLCPWMKMTCPLSPSKSVQVELNAGSNPRSARLVASRLPEAKINGKKRKHLWYFIIMCLHALYSKPTWHFHALWIMYFRGSIIFADSTDSDIAHFYSAHARSCHKSASNSFLSPALS